MCDRRLLIAVDGPAASGKSTVSREVAKRLGLKYIDSGAIYRAITFFLLKKYNSLERRMNYLSEIKDISIRQTFNYDGTSSTYLNDEDVSSEIRDESINKNIGIVSDDKEIRNYVNIILRKWAGKESIIMDGRDIGTVVLSEANVKIYLDASVDVRAVRRVIENDNMGKDVDVENIKKQIVQRDEEDKSRPFGCLRKAHDAIYIDTSDMNKEEVIQNIIGLVST